MAGELPAIGHGSENSTCPTKIALCHREAGRDVVFVEQVAGVDGEAPAVDVVSDHGIDQRVGGGLEGVGEIALAGTDIADACAEAETVQRTFANGVIGSE